MRFLSRFLLLSLLLPLTTLSPLSSLPSATPTHTSTSPPPSSNILLTNPSALTDAIHPQELAMRRGASMAAYDDGLLYPQPGVTTCAMDGSNIHSDDPFMHQCCNTYHHLYSDMTTRTIEVAVFLSYFNSDDPPLFLMDHSMRDSLYDALQSKCPSPVATSQSRKRIFTACEFQQLKDKNDHAAYSLVKTIKGPDGQDRYMKIRFYTSSISLVDEVNRVEPGKSIQDRHSDEMDAMFHDAMSNADVVFYVGHSRDGGGPDFHTPHLTSKGHVNYPWYKQNTPGLTKLLHSLHTRKVGKLKLLSLLSCSSDGHFLQQIKNAAPDVGIIGSKDLTPADQMAGGVVATINSLITFSCYERFHQLLNPHSLIPDGKQFEISGFFGEKHTVSHSATATVTDKGHTAETPAHTHTHSATEGEAATAPKVRKHRSAVTDTHSTTTTTPAPTPVVPSTTTTTGTTTPVSVPTPTPTPIPAPTLSPFVEIETDAPL